MTDVGTHLIAFHKLIIVSEPTFSTFEFLLYFYQYKKKALKQRLLMFSVKQFLICLFMIFIPVDDEIQIF